MSTSSLKEYSNRLFSYRPDYNEEIPSTYRSIHLEDLESTNQNNQGKPISVQDLLDRFTLLGNRIKQLDRLIDKRNKLAGRFIHKTRQKLESFQFQLKEHRDTWKMVEQSPSATSRRSFLEDQVSELEGRMYQISRDHFESIRKLEREKYDLLADYLQLKRVAESLD